MNSFIINYNNGFKEEVNGTLEEAMKLAEHRCSYTGESISIINNYMEVARLQWYGVPADENDIVTFDFGDYGFYGEWIIIGDV